MQLMEDRVCRAGMCNFDYEYPYMSDLTMATFTWSIPEQQPSCDFQSSSAGGAEVDYCQLAGPFFVLILFFLLVPMGRLSPAYRLTVLLAMVPPRLMF
jgi:hypothetical protein